MHSDSHKGTLGNHAAERGGRAECPTIQENYNCISSNNKPHGQ